MYFFLTVPLNVLDMLGGLDKSFRITFVQSFILLDNDCPLYNLHIKICVGRSHDLFICCILSSVGFTFGNIGSLYIRFFFRLLLREQ